MEFGRVVDINIELNKPNISNANISYVLGIYSHVSPSLAARNLVYFCKFN